MNIINSIRLVLVGAIAGYFSGLVGIGGGVIIVPALVLFFGFNQFNAQGTTLAMLIPPIGILAVMKYYQKGHVDIRTAAILCVGFILGGYLGSLTAVGINEASLKKIFASVLLGLGVKMFFS